MRESEDRSFAFEPCRRSAPADVNREAGDTEDVKAQSSSNSSSGAQEDQASAVPSTPTETVSGSASGKHASLAHALSQVITVNGTVPHAVFWRIPSLLSKGSPYKGGT